MLSVVVSTKKFPCLINYIMYDRTMRTVQQSIALFASLLLVLLLLLIGIYDCVGVYDEAIIMDWYVGQWCFVMPTYLVNLLSCPCPCPSVPPTIQAWTYDWVMLLIVFIWWCHVGSDDLVHGWHDSVTTVRDDCSWWWCRFQYCMSGAMKYIYCLVETNGNTTDSSSFSSLSTSAAVTVASAWVRRVQYLIGYGT